MSKQDFEILKSTLVNALTLVGGGRANADALTAYAALYIAELDAFYRDQKRMPTVLEAKTRPRARNSPVSAGLKEDATLGVESAVQRLASRAFGGAGCPKSSELKPYEAARRTLGIAKDETRKTLDYLVSLERRGPHALAPRPPPVPAQTPMRKGSKRPTAAAATPRRSPLRDVNANTVTESPVKKKSKKKAAPRSSGVTLEDQNAMAMRMSSTKRVDWTVSRPTNIKDENEEKPRILDVVGKPARKMKVKVKIEAKDDSSVSSSATPTAVAARATSVATSTLKNKVKVVKDTNSASTSTSTTASASVASARVAAPTPIAVAVTAAGSKTNKTRSALSIPKTDPSTPT